MSEDRKPPNVMQYASAGMEFIAAVGIMLGLGLLLDRWLATAPVFILIGTLVGFTAGLYRLVKIARTLDRRDRNGGDKPR